MDTPGKPCVLKCPNCGGAVTLRAAGLSVSVVCQQCGSLLDVARDDIKLLEKAWKSKRTLLIPLGSRATLEGNLWEVVGYQVRSSGSAKEARYAWDEYLLYNPRYGFRFLAQAEGHWTLYRVIKRGMPLPRGARFERFFDGQVRVDYVLGEFYWRIKKGDTMHVTDSIAPPYVLSVERDADEINTALGIYIPATEITAAFQLDPNAMPKARGVAANQPSPFSQRMPDVLRIAMWAVLVATLIQFGQAFFAANQLVYMETFDVDTETTERTHVSPPFTLHKGLANVCLESMAVLRNDWAELGVTLVNETTLEQRNLLQSMEFYEGYDGGERWHEGNNAASNCFSSVPAGQYRLVLDPDSGVFHKSQPGRQTFSERLYSDAPIWSNWLVLMLALLPYPLFLWLRHHSFEYRRWSESDYMPKVYASIKNSLNGEDE